MIQKLSRQKGMTAEGLEKLTQKQFGSSLDNLNRVEAHKLIQHING